MNKYRRLSNTELELLASSLLKHLEHGVEIPESYNPDTGAFRTHNFKCHTPRNFLKKLDELRGLLEEMGLREDQVRFKGIEKYEVELQRSRQHVRGVTQHQVLIIAGVLIVISTYIVLRAFL